MKSFCSERAGLHHGSASWVVVSHCSSSVTETTNVFRQLAIRVGVVAHAEWSKALERILRVVHLWDFVLEDVVHGFSILDHQWVEVFPVDA